MKLTLRHIPVHPLLKAFVEQIFVLEADSRIPDPDMKIIVPDGCVKLVIPVGNGLIGQREGYSRTSVSDQITLVGIADIPFTVDVQQDAPSTILTVELSPLGVYRFFAFSQSEAKNYILHIDEVFGRQSKEIEQKIADAISIEDKADVIQAFLISRILQLGIACDSIYEYCIQRIKSTRGGVSVKELEIETGYSSRWLNKKFEDKIGISPKTLSAITRFQFVFQALANNPQMILQNKEYYHLYYDQSHFIKEFKRFTGMPPKQFESMENQFSTIFYRK